MIDFDIVPPSSATPATPNTPPTPPVSPSVAQDITPRASMPPAIPQVGTPHPLAASAPVAPGGPTIPHPPSPTAPGSADYAKIFDQPKSGALGLLIKGVLLLLLIVVIVGAVNRFVYDFGLGELLPFLAKKTSTTTSTPSTTSTSVTQTTTSDSAATIEPEAKQRDLQRKADLALIQSALAVYKEKQGAYPGTAGRVKLSDPTNPASVALVPIFLASMPKDPQDPSYSYQYQSDGQTYSVTSIIEDTLDPQAKSGGSFYFYELNPAITNAASSTTPSQ